MTLADEERVGEGVFKVLNKSQRMFFFDSVSQPSDD